MHYSRNDWNALFEEELGERLPGKPPQGVREQSSIQNYKVGARRRYRGWTFHYGRMSVAIPSATGKYRLAGCLTPILAANEILLTVAAAAGQKLITIPDAVSSENYYQNGTIECWPSVAGTFEFHRIMSSTPSNGTTVTLTLEDNLDNALAVGDMVLPMPSPYYAIGPMGAVYAGRQQAVGLPLIPVTVNYYAWLITYGEVFLSCQGGGWPQDTAGCMDVFAWQDGTVAHLGAWGAGTYDGGGTSPQRVGYGLYGGDYGTGRIMLQLDP